MADVRRDYEGRITGLEPTVGDFEREQQAKENRISAKQTKQAEAYFAKRRPKRQPTDMELREEALEGAKRVQRRLERDGDHAAAEVAKLVDTAGEELREYTLCSAELEQPRPDIISEAAAPIAKRLVKAVGGFDSDAEAVDFVARLWPLKKARTDAVRQQDHFGHVNKKRGKHNVAFWTALEKVAQKSRVPLDEIRMIGRM